MPKQLPVRQLFRNFNLGWIILLSGMVALSAGLSMHNDLPAVDSFLCFDAGCASVQSWSNVVLAGLMLSVGTVMILKEKEV
ncbi:hypothetical protein [Lewinella sp. IMCC34191]|uniref:hypothetical protein n=1 Tax=Lewinella sp. IMCC34191 TaxID=2259172 RepID=UPI001300849F|nr:hypothetical protein [Lewinella sp. IMCC34191]